MKEVPPGISNPTQDQIWGITKPEVFDQGKAKSPPMPDPIGADAERQRKSTNKFVDFGKLES